MYFQYQKLTFTEEITDINQIQRSVGSSTTMKMDSKQVSFFTSNVLQNQEIQTYQVYLHRMWKCVFGICKIKKRRTRMSLL